VAGKRTVLVSFWVPPEEENPEVVKQESTVDLLGASAAAMLHGITGGLDAALKLKVLRRTCVPQVLLKCYTSTYCSSALFVAIAVLSLINCFLLKCLLLMNSRCDMLLTFLFKTIHFQVDSMEDSVAREVALRLKVAAYEERYGSRGSGSINSSTSLSDKSNQQSSLGLVNRRTPSHFSSGDRGGSGFAPGGQEVLQDNMEGYRHQVRGSLQRCFILSFLLFSFYHTLVWRQ
jgi:hypothetical protein